MTETTQGTHQIHSLQKRANSQRLKNCKSLFTKQQDPGQGSLLFFCLYSNLAEFSRSAWLRGGVGGGTRRNGTQTTIQEQPNDHQCKMPWLHEFGSQESVKKTGEFLQLVLPENTRETCEEKSAKPNPGIHKSPEQPYGNKPKTEIFSYFFLKTERQLGPFRFRDPIPFETGQH